VHIFRNVEQWVPDTKYLEQFLKPNIWYPTLPGNDKPDLHHFYGKFWWFVCCHLQVVFLKNISIIVGK